MRMILAFALLMPSLRPDKPNVVLCMADDLGWGDVSYNGLKAIKTANLDAMAAAALRFDRFYAAAPVCSPTRGSVLTGRHPNRYGTFSPGRPIRAQEMTIAQALKGAGYATGHFGKWHLNGVSGPGKIVAADDPLNPGRLGFDEWLSVSNYFETDWTLSRKGTPETFKGDGSDYIVEQALKFAADAVRGKKPFLAVVWFGNPHTPHKPLPEDEKAAGSAYYGEVLGIDRAMGRLRAELRTLGVAENTIVWFCSDNGATGPGSTGGLRGKKASCWEGGVRVPGILEWPARVRKPAVTAIPAVTSDIYPTILELADVKVAGQIEPLDGVSLVPLLDGKMSERARPIGFWHYAGGGGKGKGAEGLDRERGHAAITEDRLKLHKLDGKFELYDLVADPNEQKDLAAERRDDVGRLRAALDAWQQSVSRSYAGADYAKK